jgi:hypothetical protein
VLRRCRLGRWLILSLAIVALVALPPLRTACACVSCGTTESSACCSAAKAAGSAKACCCAAQTCCSTPAPAATCCTTTESTDGCECTAVPDSREPAPVPSSDSPLKEVTSVTTLQADWLLPAVVPVVADGCHEAAFGPPPRAVSVQIAFCVWRN